jgi:hypothetical protein
VRDKTGREGSRLLLVQRLFVRDGAAEEAGE